MDQSDLQFALSLEQEGAKREPLVGDRDQSSVHAFRVPLDDQPQGIHGVASASGELLPQPHMLS